MLILFALKHILIHSPGGQQVNTTLNLDIQPNPAAAGTVFVLSGLPPEGGSLAVYDVWGKMLWQSPVGAEQSALEFDTKALPSGAYIVHLRTGQGAVVKVLMVKM